MQRKEWKFEYTAARLAEAAAAKIEHHRARFEFWRGKREEVLARIRAEGLEIDEKIVMGYQNPKARDWERANRVSIRDDLRQHLDECLDKLRAHTEWLAQYDGWNQLLTANPEQRVALDIEDWLFDRWLERNGRHGREIGEALAQRGIVSDLEATRGVAGWAYRRAQQYGALLWIRKRETRSFPQGLALPFCPCSFR